MKNQVIEPFSEHRVLPPEAQAILKDAATECQKLRTLTEREGVINRAIKVVRQNWPRYFRDERNSFDSLGYFIVGWSE